MKHRLELVSCNLCGKDKPRLKWRIKSSMYYPKLMNALSKVGRDPPEYFDIVQCRHCGLVYTNPRYSSEDQTESYESQKPGKAKETFIQKLRKTSERNRLNSRMQEIERYAKGILLDVGCADGKLLTVAKERGWKVIGVEPFGKEAAACRKLGLDVKTGTLDTVKLKADSINATNLSDVIEHLPDPSKTLEQVHRIMKKGGLLLVSTQDIGSFNARTGGKGWDLISPASHLYQFDKKTLKAMVEKAGFRTIRLYRDNNMLRHYLNFAFAMLSRSIVFAKLFLYRLTKSRSLRSQLKKTTLRYWPPLNDHVILLARK
ncbi:MAG: class I SAM-dependent methyltransferase [Nanoarchaeota archaeon]|nr:class I SAM-dependent methyltransferase [Nanoarchaeota archaeon]